ncbi:type II secretion system protein [bacterium]|nr:type II secretion system protein [bacterium]
MNHRSPTPHSKGYTLLVLMFAVALLNIGLMVAFPVWQTQIQREREKELIFRGNQYVEAVRLFQQKYPGSFPQSLKELQKEKCIRRLYKDPITDHGRWNLVLSTGQPSREKKGESPQTVMVVPPGSLSSIDNPQILGVVSSSHQKSIKIYHNQETYDRWLFFYGMAPQKMPEIIQYGERD